MLDLEQTNKAILHEAASWLAQIDNDELSAEDRLALAEWMNRSPAHAAELRNMSALWGGIDQTIDEAIGQYRPEKIKSLSFLANTLTFKPRYAVGALAVLALCASMLLLPLATTSDVSKQHYISKTPFDVGLETNNPKRSKLVFNVDKGDRLTQTLQDGSVIHLNTDSVVEVNYSNDYRQLNLIRGEALFEVKKDPLRPFRVLAKGKIAEAVGTRFIVRIDSDDVAVTVTEGRVKLDLVEPESGNKPSQGSSSLPAPEALFLDAGQSASLVENIYEIVVLEPLALESRVAWLNDEFVFSGESLAQVVEEISRYNDVDISIALELRDTPIGGRFKTTDVDRILEALELSEGIKVTRSDDDAIYLSQ